MAARFRSGDDRGGALVELAFALPILVLIMVAAIDFARIFYTGMSLMNAARAGAQYGSASLVNSANTSTMQTTATNAVNVSGVSASASRLCQCATNAGVFSNTVPPNNCAYTCTGTGGHIIATVTVTASKDFTMII